MTGQRDEDMSENSNRGMDVIAIAVLGAFWLGLPVGTRARAIGIVLVVPYAVSPLWWLARAEPHQVSRDRLLDRDVRQSRLRDLQSDLGGADQPEG